MRWVVISLLMIVFISIGSLLIRNYFPKEKIKTVLVKEIEQLPAVIVEKILTDTVVVTKWKDRIVEKIKYRDVAPETITVYEEKVAPDRFHAFVSYLSYYKPHLDFYTYAPTDSATVLYNYKVKNDFELSFDKVTGLPAVKESRNFFDKPDVQVGWGSRNGLYLGSEFRTWRVHHYGELDNEGALYKGFIRHAF